MKAILFLLGGVLLVLAFIFYVKNYFLTPDRLFFYTVEVKKDKTHEEIVSELVKKLNENGLNVIRTLPMSKVIHERGIKDFPNYTTVLACDIPQKKEILLKVPEMSVLIPCSVAVYEREGKIYITAPSEIMFIRSYGKELGREYEEIIIRTYERLRATIIEVAEK